MSGGKNQTYYEDMFGLARLSLYCFLSVNIKVFHEVYLCIICLFIFFFEELVKIFLDGCC